LSTPREHLLTLGSTLSNLDDGNILVSWRDIAIVTYILKVHLINQKSLLEERIDTGYEVMGIGDWRTNIEQKVASLVRR